MDLKTYRRIDGERQCERDTICMTCLQQVHLDVGDLALTTRKLSCTTKVNQAEVVPQGRMNTDKAAK